MESRSFKSYAPDLYLLRDFATEQIAEISTSHEQMFEEKTPYSEWFKNADIHDVTRDVLSRVAWRVITFNFDCLDLHHRAVHALCSDMEEILNKNQIVFDLVLEMVFSHRTKLEEQEKEDKNGKMVGQVEELTY
jgi:hypothetical protein